jgi:hypothetical protein
MTTKTRKKRRESQAVLPGFDLPRWQGGPPAVRSRTSIAAAEAMREIAPTKRGEVYAWLAKRGAAGATREEIAEGLGMRLSSVCGRCRELVEMDLIYDTGTTRPGSSGREAVVVRAK